MNENPTDELNNEETEKETEKPDNSDIRVFLVLVNRNEDVRAAIRYAGKRAKKTNGRVALIHVIDTSEFQHFMGVGDLIREEAYEEGEHLLQHNAAIISSITGQTPVFYIKEGDTVNEVIKLINSEESIKILILPINPDSSDDAVNSFISRNADKLKIPVAVVPSNLSDEEIDFLT